MRIATVMMAGFIGLSAAAPAAAQGLGCKPTLSSFVRSSYLRNMDVPTKEPVKQTDLYVTCADGWGFDIWTSVSLSNGLNSDAAEIDYTLFKTGSIPQLRVNYDLGFSYYDLNCTFKLQSGDLLVPYLELTMADGFTWDR